MPKTHCTTVTIPST